MAIIIPASQMVLMRKRKQMHRLMAEKRWDEVSLIEGQLFRDINLAVNDPERSPKELLSELGSVIHVYKELSMLCRLYSKKLIQQE